MSETIQAALINFCSGLCGVFVGGGLSLLTLYITIKNERRRRKEDRLIDHNRLSIQRIEEYVDSRFSKIKSLTRPQINTNTLIDYLQSELAKESGSSEAARANAKLLGDQELTAYLTDLENIFLTAWDLQKQATKQQDLPQLEERAIDLYHQCVTHVELLKKRYLTANL